MRPAKCDLERHARLNQRDVLQKRSSAGGTGVNHAGAQACHREEPSGMPYSPPITWEARRNMVRAFAPLALAAALAAQATSLRSIYNFTGFTGDGSYPESGVVMAPDGTLYGTTLCGGNLLSGCPRKSRARSCMPRYSIARLPELHEVCTDGRRCPVPSAGQRPARRGPWPLVLIWVGGRWSRVEPSHKTKSRGGVTPRRVALQTSGRRRVLPVNQNVLLPAPPCRSPTAEGPPGGVPAGLRVALEQ